jgi:glycosyltransferase involved in cell wall biosynthesis
LNRLLLVLPLTAYKSDRIFIDRQARNGLKLWLENFDAVTLACPTVPIDPPPDCAPLDDDRVTFEPLPQAYTAIRFVKTLAPTVPKISRLIGSADYLHFAIGGLFGDWGSVAAIVASLQRRRFAAWTDRVESNVVSFNAESMRGTRKYRQKVAAVAMKRYERFVIGLSDVGLFHGMDCFDAYAPYSSNPHLVHNIHLGQDDIIGLGELERRLKRSGPLRIAYAGRVHTEKGVFDWIEVMQSLFDIEATWFGSGPDLEAAKQRAPENIKFAGSLVHDDLIRQLKTFDAFVFCHKTQESPRCLIEALICGLPIIGYDSPYTRDLIKENGGGLLTRPNPKDLARAIDLFRTNRDSLSRKARLDGILFDAESVFRHRSDLIKSRP